MANQAPIQSVWVSVIPTVEGLSTAITSEVTSSSSQGELESAGNTAGSSIAKGILASGAMVALGSALKGIVEDGLGQQADTSKITAALNLTEQEAKRVTEATGNLFASGYGESFTAVSENMRLIVGSVKDGRQASSSELEKMGRDVSNLEEAYGLSSELVLQSVQSMTGSGFAGSWDEAISVIVGGYQTMGASGEDWAESLNEFSDDFVNIGVNGTQAIQLVNAAIKSGIKDTDAFVDALNEVVIKVNDGTADESLIGLGLNPEEVRKNFKEGGAAATAQFGEILNTLKKDGTRADWAGIFGTKAEDYALAFENFDISTMNQQLSEGTGDVEKFNTALNDSAQNTLLTFQRSINAAFIDTLKPALEFITPLLQTFVTFLQENEAAATAISIVVGVLFVAAIVAATAALWGMVAPILANPIVWIVFAAIVAIAALAAGLYLLVENWDIVMAWMGNTWTGFIGMITDGWNNFTSWVGTGASEIGASFMSLGTDIGNFFIGIVNMVIDAINSMLSAINSIQIDFPWGGGYSPDIALIGNVPMLANGGVVKATPGGTLGILGEAGKNEAVVDEGKLNKLLDDVNNDGMAGSSSSFTYNVYMQPGESTEELFQRIKTQEIWETTGNKTGFAF